MNWRRYNKDGISFGYARLISEDVENYVDNGEVIIFNKFHDSSLLTRYTIKFKEYLDGDTMKESIDKLYEEYEENYNVPASDLTDIIFYCADGWSTWNAIERLENPNEEEIRLFLNIHEVAVV